MLRCAVLFALVALSVESPPSSEEMYSKSGPEKMSGEYEKWKMMEEKDKKVSQYQSFQKFLMFKDKLEKMEEMAKKKAVYEEFLKFKAHKDKMEEWNRKKKMDKWDSMEEKGDESDENNDHEQKFKMMIKSFKEDSKKHIVALTSAFLAMCKCQNAVGLEITELFNKQGDKKDDGMGIDGMFEMDVPDFKGNMTAKANFVKKLSPEQREKMLVHGLVKSMCSGAKTFINHTKEFKEKYMKTPEGGNMNN